MYIYYLPKVISLAETKATVARSKKTTPFGILRLNAIAKALIFPASQLFLLGSIKF